MLHHLSFNGRFSGKPGVGGALSVFVLHFFWKRSLVINVMGFFVGCMLFLSPNQQCQSNERIILTSDVTRVPMKGHCCL